MSSPRRPRPGSIEDAIGRALHLAQTGDLDAADQALHVVLERAPAHPHALHFRGMILHQKGRTAEAIEHLERAITVAPADRDVRNNLANLYLTVGRAAAGEAALREVLVTWPTFAPARFNLGVLLARTGRHDAAVDELRRAAAIAPDVDTWMELGGALLALRRHAEAVEALRRARALRPDDPAVKRRLSRAYFHLVDELDRRPSEPAVALEHLRAWLEVDPTDPIALHTLAAYGGDRAPDRCSDGYVKATFDLFADSFDHVLSEIRYEGVERSAAALLGMLGPDTGEARAVVADVGCGTGALGPLVRARCARLVGVDLSPKMVAKARVRGVYDEVVEAEITAWLGARGGAFDAVVCADTLIYFGDLRPLLGAMAGALRPGGVLVVTAEALAEDAAEDVRLDRHGRYAHRRSYLERVLAETGFVGVTVDHRAALRVEYGADVPGFVLTAALPPPAGGDKSLAAP